MSHPVWPGRGQGRRQSPSGHPVQGLLTGQISGIVSHPSVCACSSLGWDGSRQAPSDQLVFCPSLFPYPLPSFLSYTHSLYSDSFYASSKCLLSFLNSIYPFIYPPTQPSIHPSIHPSKYLSTPYTPFSCSIHLSIHLPIPPIFHPSFLLFLLFLPPSFPSLSPSPFLPSFLLSFLLTTQSSIQPSLYPSENCLDHPVIYPTSNIFFILISISSPLSSIAPCFLPLCLPTGPFNRLIIYCLSVHASIHPHIHPYFHISHPLSFTEQTEPSLASTAL